MTALDGLIAEFRPASAWLGSEAGALVVGAEPADLALCFLCGALGIEGDQSCDNLRWGEVGRPAVCRGDSLVELLVQAVDDPGPRRPSPVLQGGTGRSVWQLRRWSGGAGEN